MPNLTRHQHKPSLQQQIAELRREMALRRNVHPRMIASGRMRQGEADLAMARMQAAHDSLVWLAEHIDEVRAFIESRRAQDPQP